MNLQRTSTTAFGLIVWLEQTQIHLPLKAIECRFEASGAAVDVQIDQVFHQSAGRPLDVTYSFPLPSKAAAYRCEMIVNGRTVRAKVMEQEAAREIARQKKAEGRRTALVELERGNLFTLSLGNVQPDDIIVIRFAYVEELDAWKDELALQIPFNPGVRYVPGKPLLRPVHRDIKPSNVMVSLEDGGAVTAKLTCVCWASRIRNFESALKVSR